MTSLTPEQSLILAALDSQRQAAVYDFTGSGKTTLAVEASRAKSLLYIVSPFSVLET
jgi:superfamily II DNA or RNA helicase